MFAFIVYLPYFAKFWIGSCPDIKFWLESGEFTNKADLGWKACIGNVGLFGIGGLFGWSLMV